MPNAVTDTHALIWYLQDDGRLSVAVSKYFDQCEYDIINETKGKRT